MSACPLVVLACESLHVCTVCIWRCEHARFCVEGFYALYINFHSFIHSLQLHIHMVDVVGNMAMLPVQQWAKSAGCGTQRITSRRCVGQRRK